jgi:hypothetical protein
MLLGVAAGWASFNSQRSVHADAEQFFVDGLEHGRVVREAWTQRQLSEAAKRVGKIENERSPMLFDCSKLARATMRSRASCRTAAEAAVRSTTLPAGRSAAPLMVTSGTTRFDSKLPRLPGSCPVCKWFQLQAQRMK